MKAVKRRERKYKEKAKMKGKIKDKRETGKVERKGRRRRGGGKVKELLGISSSFR